MWSRNHDECNRVGQGRGTTLIETIAAVVVLAIAIPPMLWSIGEAHRQRIDPVLASRARWLATEKIEDIIADRHSATRGYDHLAPANYPDEDPVSGLEGYRRSVTFNETGSDLTTPGAGYMTVTVVLEWLDTSDTTRSFSVSTVLTDGEAS